MPRLLAALALLVAALAGAGGAPEPADAREWKKIRFAAAGDYPPFNSLGDDRALQGFDIDVARALCDRLKAECEFVVLDWDALIPALLAKKIDAIAASMAITEERRRTVDFTVKYYDKPVVLLARKDAATGSDPALWKGRSIGAQANTTYAVYLRDQFAPKGASVKTYPTEAAAAADLAAGRLDGVLGDSVTLYDWLERGASVGCCRFVLPEIKDARYFGEGVGVALRKEDKDLKAQLDKAISDIVRDGTHERITRKYFAFSLY